jgi:sortase A
MSDKKKAAGAVFLGVGLLLVAFTLFRAYYYIQSDEINVPDNADLIERNDPLAKPVLLTIPKINLATSIVDVGLTADHSMATPKSFSEAGWFKYGALPGEEGSAVIAGHVDNGIARPAVFYNLKDLALGDKINVKTKGEAELYFTVTKIETLDYNDRNTDVFTEKGDKFLKLITCSGKWVSKIKTHDKRLVVTATLDQA